MKTIQRKMHKVNNMGFAFFYLYSGFRSISRILRPGIAKQPGISKRPGFANQPGISNGLASQTSLVASQRSLPGLRLWIRAISKLSKMLKEQQSEKSRLLKESDRLAEKILREKQKSEGGGNRKLDSLMRDSQRLVSDTGIHFEADRGI